MTTRPSWLLPPIDQLTEFPAGKIADQLSRLERYAGSCPHFYSVARHSLLVMDLLPDDPELRLLGLIHDAHECWIGDVLLPVKKRIGFAIDELGCEYDHVLWGLLGLSPCPATLQMVDQADRTACQLELQLLGLPDAEVLAAMPGLRNRGLHLVPIHTNHDDAEEWEIAFDSLRDACAGAAT